MKKRRLERVAVMALSAAVLLSSTGIISSLAANAGESSSAISNAVSEPVTSTTVVQEGGAVAQQNEIIAEGGSLVVEDKGDGTVVNPYQISSAEDFLKMNEKINLTTSSNKNFVFTADIDLSGITEADFAKNGGSLAGVNKSLANDSSNIFFVLDGNGHKITGLNVSVKNVSAVSIFGFVNAKSAIRNLVVEKPCIISSSQNLTNGSVLVNENKGTISNVEISYPKLTLAKSNAAGIVAAVNDGTISKVTVKSSFTNASASTADNHTVSASGYVGAMAGINNGTVISSSALNIGMFVPTADTLNTVYGGIAGNGTGKISDSVSTGNVCGGKSTDAAGGIVGKAETGLKLTNNYTLVSIAKTVLGCAVIGSNGKSDMMSDCYWSETVSERNVPVTDFGGSLNNLSTKAFKLVNVGNEVKISKADAGSTKWGKAVFELDGEFKADGYKADASEITVKGVKADTVTTVTYVAKISLPANVGSGAAVKQYMNINVITVPEKAVGNGTKESPLEISNADEFAFFGSAPELSCKLTKDIAVSKAVPVLNGILDGNGHTVTVNGQLFGTVKGTVKNLNVLVNTDASSAVFGDVIGAAMSGVSVSQKNGVKFNAVNANTGIFANKIIDKSTFDDCRVFGNIAVASDKLSNIGAFAGYVAGEGSVFTNSGASTNLTVAGSGKIATAAGFIGAISAENTVITNCYVSGANKAGKYMFIGALNAKAATIKNIYTDYSADKDAAAEAMNFSTATVDKKQFSEWKFDEGGAGFFTGKGGKFTAALPAVKAMQNSTAADFVLAYDKTKLNASVTSENGKLTLNVGRADGVVTVKTAPVTVTSTKTGLSAVINVSNGLEKDSKGNWVVSSGYDLMYISENIAELNSASFVVSADLDMADVDGFTPIGSTAVAFSGTFDGCGHAISNLTINGTAKTALFGTLSDAVVKNIRFEKVTVNSQGGYAAAVAGQATGKTVISGIIVENSSVSVSENYAAAIVASVDGASDVKLSDITVKNSAVKSSAGYVGAVAGHISDNTVIDNASVEGFTASGSNYISGIVGFAQGDANMIISNVKVAGSKLSGVSEISGIASGSGKGTAIKNAEVKSSEISTVGSDSSFVAGGISAVYASSIENGTVDSVKVNAGIAGGIVGKTEADGKLVIKNAAVKASEISASEANTVAAGILAVHNVKGSAVISGSSISDDTVISGAAVTAGVVGDCSGAESSLSVENTKSFADVKGSETANAVCAAGILGRIGTSAINNIVLTNVTAGGKVSGNGVLGGIIGLVKKGEAYNGTAPVVSSSLAYAQIDSANTQAQIGMIIGGVEDKNVLNSEMLDKAVSNVIISTYYGQTSAYSAESGLKGGKYVDMDKPNGKPVSVSEPVLSTSAETPVTIGNLPKVNGFSFDSAAGWISESDERIQVVSCTENTAVLKANHMADISVIGYYVLDSDVQVRVPVHFAVASDIRTPLKGSGTKADPYLVSCAYDLETVAQYSNSNAYFALTDDIVFKPEDFEFGGAFYNVGNGVVTIGDATNGFKGIFTGLYNGKVHSITGLSLAGNTFGGLFGATDGAAISDLVINNADVTGLNYAGVLVGSARNTTIKNITINSAMVNATEFGGYVGAVAGYAENTTIENVKINSAEVKTTLEATGATVEIAGGVAGVFSGEVKNTELSGVTVESGTIAGGIIGVVRDESVKLAAVKSDAAIASEIAGGAIGRIENPLKLSINECVIGGTVNGSKISAGVIAQITADSAEYSVENLKSALISDTVITAKVADSEISGIVCGEASADVFSAEENGAANVFDKVYYSSYQNGMHIFGNEEINAYQNNEYSAVDLSSLKYVSGGEEKENIPLNKEYTVLGADSIKLNGVSGSYKEFTAGGMSFKLEKITSAPEGAISYDAAKSAIRLENVLADAAKAVFVYNNGLELAIDVTQSDDVLKGKGTEAEPYEIFDTEDFGLMLQNAADKNVYYKLTNDIKLSGVGSAELFAANLDGNGFVLYDFTGTSLFSRFTGTVKNVGFVGFNVSDRESASVGAVAGIIDGGKVTDSFVIANVAANGRNQDAGILAGRAVNEAVISNVLTSGKAVALNGLSVGGAVGTLNNSKLTNVTSTAYVKGGDKVGGIVGDAYAATVEKAVFGGMAESSNGLCGNIIGSASDVKTSGLYVDNQTVRSDTSVGSDTGINASEYKTSQMITLRIDGFDGVGGYPVPETLAEISNAKFKTGVEFASMFISYYADNGESSARNYTRITAADSVNGNEVKLDTNSGLKLVLVPSADYAGAENEIARYSNPVSNVGLSVNYKLVDKTNGLLGDKLVGVMIKTKAGDSAYSFDTFAKADSKEKSINSVVASDGGIFAAAELPENVKYSVSAVDENGNALSVKDAKNEGSLIETGSANTVVITITAEKDSGSAWGLHSVWNGLG